MSGWALQVYITRIYWEDRYGKETELEALRSLTVLELNWPGHGKSRVKLHDEGVTWYRYASTN